MNSTTRLAILTICNLKFAAVAAADTLNSLQDTGLEGRYSVDLITSGRPEGEYDPQYVNSKPPRTDYPSSLHVSIDSVFAETYSLAIDSFKTLSGQPLVFTSLACTRGGDDSPTLRDCIASAEQVETQSARYTDDSGDVWNSSASAAYTVRLRQDRRGRVEISVEYPYQFLFERDRDHVWWDAGTAIYRTGN